MADPLIVTAIVVAAGDADAVDLIGRQGETRRIWFVRPGDANRRYALQLSQSGRDRRGGPGGDIQPVTGPELQFAGCRGIHQRDQADVTA